MDCFQGSFNNKKVLVTGHTGFKGSWLTQWLKMLGAEVYGISKDIPTIPSLYESLAFGMSVNDSRFDLCDLNKLSDHIRSIQPDFLFHLAAQPIVKTSYTDPIDTWRSNMMGTVNILESLRYIENKCTIVMITSDKAYKNKEWIWGYREDDELGGDDPYSASKGAAELAIRSYYQSFLKHKANLSIGIARAGNVIGGGDWAANRLIPDCIRSWVNKQCVSLRSPYSTRPWQHVLEPLSGYLTLAKLLSTTSDLNGEAFNFGPNLEKMHTVEDVVQAMAAKWSGSKWEISSQQPSLNAIKFKECNLLQLSCEKSLHYLSWKSTLDFSQTINMTMDWYIANADATSMAAFTRDQILCYVQQAIDSSLEWSR